MELKVAANSMHWSQPSVPQSPSLASAISSPSSKRRRFVAGEGALFCRYSERSALFLSVPQLSKLTRSRSCGNKRSSTRIIRRALASSLDSFSDEEFSKKIQDLAMRFQQTEDGEVGSSRMEDSELENRGATSNSDSRLMEENQRGFNALEPPNFPERDEIIPANIEWKANSVDIPLSLRIIRRKKQWQEGFVEAGESAYCSVKRAFSSMVFIIRELHSYTLQMREALFYEDLQEIIARVQKDMHASFVWLFEKVFSHTPTLMVYVMILLANYSVHSLSSNGAIAATLAQPCAVATEEVSVVEDQTAAQQNFDSSIVRTLKFSSSNGKTASMGGNGGGKYRTVANGTEGDGRFDGSSNQPTMSPYGASSIGQQPSWTGEESILEQESGKDDATLWDSVVDEASKMQAASRDESLDQDMMQVFVSPVDASIETDEYSEHLGAEIQYQTQLACDPNNPLLLANYAQFLYLVAKDYDRAEDYFKRATKDEPRDAETLNKYANFLWHAKNDLWAAEETYLEAISVEPSNSHYAASYAHFLWNTGGEDTCFPLSSPDE